MSFGQWLAHLRKQRQLTQQQLAYAADLSLRTITGAEQGRRHLYLGTAAKIARALGFSLDDLTTPQSEGAARADQ